MTQQQDAERDQRQRPMECRSCHRLIHWRKSRTGAWAPFDPDGMSHFASCPDSDRWRRRP